MFNDLYFRPDPPAPDPVGAEPEAFTCPKCNKEFRNMTLLTRSAFPLSLDYPTFPQACQRLPGQGLLVSLAMRKQSLDRPYLNTPDH